MAFLQGKKILITGLLSNRSIALGIAEACKREGAELAFTYVGDRFKDRITSFAKEMGSEMIYECDVGSDEQIEYVFAEIEKEWGRLGWIGPFPSVSLPVKPLQAIFSTVCPGKISKSPMIFPLTAIPAMVKAARHLMGPGSSALALTYLGANRAIPYYNTMGLAKASLEASVRYMSESLGKHGVRVNAISAGPVKTIAASGIRDFNILLNFVAQNAPLRRNVTIEEIGNAAAFLLSDLASGITGEITYVDGGFSHVMGLNTDGVVAQKE